MKRMVERLRGAGRRVVEVSVGAVRFHPRLYLALALGVLVFLALPVLAERVRFLVAFDVAAAAWLIMALRLILRCDAAAVRRRADRDDDGAWVALLVAVVVTATSLGAVIIEAGDSDGGLNRGAHVSMAAGTLALSWLFFHSLFAFHYAHEYYDAEEADTQPVLGFPGGIDPDYWDFLYFSFNYGTASQTADVTVNSQRLRRFALLHQIASYIFNATVIALGVNVAAALM